MVEEIVGRYIAAQPKPQIPRKKKWPYAVGAVAVVALLLMMNGLNGKLNRLNGQYNNLQSSISNIQNNVGSQIGGISNRVEEVLKSQNNLTASYSTSLVSVDPAAGTATFSVQAVPKTYMTGMTAVFRAAQAVGGEITEAEGVLDEKQGFSAELTCPLSDDITLSVVFTTGEKQETQLLEQYGSLYSATLPEVAVEDWELMFIECKEHTLELKNTYITLYEDGDMDSEAVAFDNNQTFTVEPAQVRSARVGLFQNQKLVAWAEPCGQPANYEGFEGYEFYRLPDLTLTVTASDMLAVAAVITDEYDRELIQVGSYYVLDEQDENLTWPGNIALEYTGTTEGWIY